MPSRSELGADVQLDTRRLRIFFAVADTLHFGRAAERLRLSQPSVSQQVAHLEVELGCRLFERSSSSVSLTPAGRDLVAHLGPVLRELDQQVDAFLQRHGSDRPLRVGVLSSLANGLVPTAVSSLALGSAPVELVEGALSRLTDQVRRGELDVAFCYSTGAPDVFQGLKCQTLDRRPITVALPDDDPLSAKPELQWAELAKRPWVMPSASRQYREDMLERFASRGLTVHTVAEATTLTGQLALVAAGIGLTFTSPWASVPDGVIARPTAGPGPELELLAIQNSAATRLEPAERLISVVGLRACTQDQ